MKELTEEDKQRIIKKEKKYVDLMHAMQSGVAQKMIVDSGEIMPKHLRVGVNSAMVTQAAVTRLLIEKGIITWDEFWDTLIEEAEREVKKYEEELSRMYNVKITLA